MKQMRLIRRAALLIILGSLVLAACSSKAPQLQLEANVIDLGEVVEGEIVTRQVSLANDGSAPLEIFSVSTSCGCTTASFDTSIVQPGEQAVLTVEYDSGAHDIEGNASVHRQIFIASNDPDHPELVIDLRAEVVAAAD